MKDNTASTVVEKKTCYYCGVRELCDYDFHKEDMRNITCDKSCLTFDGYTNDNKRIIVRDCGYFVANECKDNQLYEGGVAKGRVCHCKDKDFCNHGSNPQMLTTEVLLVSFLLLVSNIYILWD